MDNVLSVVWYGAAAASLVAIIVALLRPGARGPALLVATLGLTVAGVLGILSIGILFLAAAVACGVLAARHVARTPHAGSPEV